MNEKTFFELTREFSEAWHTICWLLVKPLLPAVEWLIRQLERLDRERT